METYGISTYGKQMLIKEPFEDRPPLRLIAIGINILLFLVPLYQLTSQYLSRRSSIHKRRMSSGLLTSTFVAFTVNNVLRNCHMIDHILRPIYYHEPKWAYQKYIITTMEVATYANIMVATVGLLGMGKLLKVIESGNRKGLTSALAIMVFYVANSLFNLVHYTIEPPWNYGPLPNLNIAGTAITNVPIVFLLIHIYKNHGASSAGGSNQGKEKLLDSSGKSKSSQENVGTSRLRSTTPVRK